MFHCPKCDHELAATPEAGTPCPICGTEMIAAKPPELDPQWVAEKEAKIAAHAAEGAKKPSRTVAVVILSLVMAAMLAVIVVMVMQRQPDVKGEALSGVEITINAPKPGTPITVDGVRAGKTPQSLKVKGSRTRPIRIEGNNVVKIVTPDRDQIVNLVP